MKRYILLTLCWSCAYLASTAGNTDTCNAHFDYVITGNTVQFTTGQPARLHYWEFGDGSSSTAFNPQHTYAGPGTYRVLQRVTDSLQNCFDTVSKWITIPPACPVGATFTFYRDSLDCKKIHFINQSVPANTAVHFTWKFGDGTTSADINPTHVYTTQGDFTVCLDADSGSHCHATFCNTVGVHCDSCALQVKFEWQKDSVNGLEIHFTNETVVPTANVKYQWNFGDSATSADRNAVHVYRQPGTYQVCLTVWASNTCVKEWCTTVVVAGTSCNLQAAFESRVDSTQENKVYFINHTVTTTTAVHFVWSFGDGATSTETNPVHIYARAGEYKVCLVAETNTGCRSEWCNEVEVHVRVCTIQARYEWRRDTLQWNKAWFTNVSQPAGSIWRTYWNYGDGSASQDVNSFHTYSKAGRYQVCLTVVSLDSCVSTYCDSVTILPPATACDAMHVRFDYIRDPGKPNRISFIATGDGPLTKQVWTITRDSAVNGNTWRVVLDQNNPNFIFPFEGWYTVCLAATTGNNCVKEYCGRIHIEQVVTDSGHKEAPILVYPNPATNTVRLILKLDNSAAITVSVLTAGGVVEEQLLVNGQAGNNVITIPVDKLSHGQYLVELRYANQVRWAKFQKL